MLIGSRRKRFHNMYHNLRLIIIRKSLSPNNVGIKNDLPLLLDPISVISTASNNPCIESIVG